MKLVKQKKGNQTGRCWKGFILANLICILIIFSQSGISPVKAQSQVTGVITLISDVKEGSGTYASPYVIDTNIIEWRLDDTYGPDRDSVTYMTDVHMSGDRSCATQVEYDDLSWLDIQGGVFILEAMAGKYYIRIRVYADGGYEDTNIWVYCRVPPVKPFTLPYTPPPGNHRPIPVVDIINEIGGSGSYGDPYVISGHVVKFRVDNSYDLEGVEDIKFGVSNWAITCKPHHPKYSGIEGTRDPKETYLYWDDMNGVIFEWDTEDRPSEDGTYSFDIMVIDQHGERSDYGNRHFLHFMTSSSPPCECFSWQDKGCGQGSCVADEMYQTRTCTPSGCSSESRCVSNSSCQTPIKKADLNSDGKVDVIDLGILLSNWGKTTKPPADINQDGHVDVIDLGIQLSNWG